MAVGKNSKSELKLWAKECIRKTKYNQQTRNILVRQADFIIDNGGYRGDVSDKWKAMGYNTADIPDMYP